MLEELHASQAELFQAIDNAPPGSAMEEELLARLRDLSDEITEEVSRAALSAAVAERDAAKSKVEAAREDGALESDESVEGEPEDFPVEESVESLGTARTDTAAAGSLAPSAPAEAAPVEPANSPRYPSSNSPHYPSPAPESPGSSFRPVPLGLSWGLPLLAGIATFLWPNSIAPEPIPQPRRPDEEAATDRRMSDAEPLSEPGTEAQPRRWGEDQLCTDEVLDELHDEVHPRCESGGCSPTREREELGYTTRKAYHKAIAAGLGWQCPEILERLGDAEDCLALRKAIDEECFRVPVRGGNFSPEYIEAFKGHQRQIESALYAVTSCEDLAEARGCR